MKGQIANVVGNHSESITGFEPQALFMTELDDSDCFYGGQRLEMNQFCG